MKKLLATIILLIATSTTYAKDWPDAKVWVTASIIAEDLMETCLKVAKTEPETFEERCGEKMRVTIFLWELITTIVEDLPKDTSVAEFLHIYFPDDPEFGMAGLTANKHAMEYVEQIVNIMYEYNGTAEGLM